MLVVPPLPSRPPQKSPGCCVKVGVKEECLCPCLTVVLADSASFYPALCPGEKLFCSFSFPPRVFAVSGGMWLELKLNGSRLERRKGGDLF